MFNRNKDIFFIKVLNKILNNTFSVTEEDKNMYSVCYSKDLSVVVIASYDDYCYSSDDPSVKAGSIVGDVYILAKQGNEYKLVNNGIDLNNNRRTYERVYDISIADNNKAILIAYCKNYRRYIDILHLNSNTLSAEDSTESLVSIVNEDTISLDCGHYSIESTVFTCNEHFGFKVLCHGLADNHFILYYKYNVKTNEYLLHKKSKLLHNEYLTDGCSILFY